MTPLKAIRKKCIECCCGNKAEVRECNITTCSLHQYRMGHNPARQGERKNKKTDTFSDEYYEDEEVIEEYELCE